MTLTVRVTLFELASDKFESRIWMYRAADRILDIMTDPGYFAALHTKLSVGDVVIVQCAGFYDLVPTLSSNSAPTHRPGGGVLMVSAKTPEGMVFCRIIGRGLRRFFNPGDGDISKEDALTNPARSSDIA